ncbi:MAG: TonB family protein [Chitinophagales bacterium]
MLPILAVLGGLIAVIFLMVFIIKLFFNRKSTEDIIKENQGKPESQSVFVKKYEEANLNKYHGLFLRVGLIFSLGLVILAFSWTTYEKQVKSLGEVVALDEFEIEPPQTQREPPPPPPPPPPEIKVVEDEEIIEEEIEIDIEIEEDTEIEMPEQIEEEEVNEDEIFQVVEDMPQFPGGEQALLKYLASIPYPAIAKENDIEGSVFIRFVIDKEGNVTSVQIAKGTDKILNEAALKHVKKMPKWTPGKQRGKAVKVQYVVPIKFRLS